MQGSDSGAGPSASGHAEVEAVGKKIEKAEWERDVRAKLQRLAGEDISWLLQAARAIAEEPESVKMLVLEMSEDQARRLVQKAIDTAAATQPPATQPVQPAQIDMYHQAGSPQLYANLKIKNSLGNHDQDLSCTVEALVDTGCHYDLVLPGNKVKHLHLAFLYDTTTAGFGGGSVRMAVFSPLEVTIKLDAPDGPQEKVGYLTPACIKHEYDNADSLDTVLCKKDRWQEFPKAVDKDGRSVLELSPVRRPREAGVIPSTILGLSGLKQLRLIVDAAHSQLMPLVEIGLIV